MTNELAVTYEADGSEVNLDPSVVLKYLIDPKQEVMISNKEMAKIIMTCAARKLNPYTGDVVITPFTGRDRVTTCSLIVTKDFFARRAANNPHYRGKEAGVCILSADGRPVKRAGSCVYKDLSEKLIGGWCRVFVEGREPEYVEVSLDEYNQHRNLWNTKPGTMIRKVAVSQALREAFPDDFNGLYEPEEMGIEENSIPYQAAPVLEVEEIQAISEQNPAEISEEIPLYEPINPDEFSPEFSGDIDEEMEDF